MYVGQNWGFAETFGLKSMKSIMLAVLMVSMSLSVGLVELNKAPWLVEDAESVLEESNKPMYSTAPSISYSSSTLTLSNNTAMTPLTVTNSGGTVGIPVATKITSMDEYFSLALDSNGYRHASLSDNDNFYLKYATDGNGAWVNITVDDTANVGDHNSIAVDSGDGVHIAYQDSTNFDLKYAACLSSCALASSWANITIDAPGSVGWHTSIAIDSDDEVHISYTDQTNNALKYATCAATCTSIASWSNVSVDNMGNGDNKKTGIAIDSSDAVHIAYVWHQGSGDDYYMRYTTCSTPCASSSSWTNTTGMSLLKSFRNAHIAIDPNDGLHIAGRNDAGSEIIYLNCASSCTSNSSWSNISAVTTGNVGGRLSLAVDSNNNPHMSYQDFTYPWTLEYATCASSCTSDSSLWSKGTVDSTGFGGFGTSIAVNHNNDSVHIIHLHFLVMELVYLSSDTAPYSVSPELPIGLILDWSNGEISGTPTELSSSTTYTITARNSYGSDTTTLTISVDAPPLMSYDWGTGSSDFQSFEYVNNKVSVGPQNTCAILESGSLMCWGQDNQGQLGNGGTNTKQGTPDYVNLPAGRKAVAVSTGEFHTCAILDNGSMMCWGDDTFGQLGNGAIITADKDEPVYVNLPSGRTAVGLTVGWSYVCAILDTGSLMCWGLNNKGQLGNGGTTDENSPVSVDLPYGRTAVAVDAGEKHTCAILDTGSLMCWGKDNKGQLGNGATTGDQPSPVYVDLPTGRTAVSIVAGKEHSCAILDNRDMMCWGKDGDSQLGNGAGTTDQVSPVYVDLPTGLNAVMISAGASHTCAVLDNAYTYCWGSDDDGKLGNGATTTGDQPSPVYVNLPTGRTPAAISPGGPGASHTCVILDDASMKCWGEDTNGQLGDGGTDSGQDSPVSVSGSHAWDNTTNLVSSTLELGQNKAMSSLSPTLNSGYGLPTSCTSTALPDGLLLSNTCVLTGTPTTLGNTTLTITPTNAEGSGLSVSLIVSVYLSVPSISYGWDTGSSDVLSMGYANNKVTAGSSHTCAILDNGDLKCWGRDNYGHLGDGGSNTDQGSPVSVSGSNTWDDTAYFVSSTLWLVQNVAMSLLSPTLDAGSAPTSCTSTGLPPGLFLSSTTCVLSGTPTDLGSTTLIITPSNTAGSGLSVGLIVNVNASGGSLIINTTSTEANLGSAMSDITMSYTHTSSVQNWASGVTNSTINPAATIPSGGLSKHSIDSGLNGDIAAVYSVEQTGATSADLTLLYQWNGTWTESTIDNSVDTDVASVAIDRQGALHIGYVDKDNANLKYATNSTGSWVIETLGDAATGGIAHTAISVHPATNAVHIMAVNGSDTNADLKHYTNETGTWLNSTISNPSEDEGYGVKADLDSDGNLHVVFIREAGSVSGTAYDYLILASRINGVWQNQTISLSANRLAGVQGITFDMAIDSQSQIHVTFQGRNALGRILHHGVLSSVNPSSSWVLTQRAALGLWPGLAIDSNDNVHLSYHTAESAKNQYYQKYTSGAWSSGIETSATSDGSHGAYYNEMTTDSNDDVFIFARGEVVSSCRSCDLRITMIQGLGPSLATNPIFEVSPELPNGLTMNWRNGTISGTPTEAHANTTHTVTVTAFGATTTETFTLLVLQAADISYPYSSYTFTKNSPVSGVTPTNVGGAPDEWIISPEISTTIPGLSFNAATGAITGAPTGIHSATAFTVWANNSADNISTTISITVNDIAPVFTYSSLDVTLTNNTAVTLSPISTGGAVTTWEYVGTEPLGLDFEGGNGSIWGTPTVVQSKTQYLIWGNNSGGETLVYMNITISDVPVSLSYASDNYNLTRAVTMATPISPVYTGIVGTWVIEPSPTLAGLSWDSSTGVISGTPNINMTRTEYTVWANNTGGNVSHKFNITINEPIVNLAYSPAAQIFVRSTTITNWHPTVTGGNVKTWGIEPSLTGTGLSFANGVISGTPTINMILTPYIVWANTTGGETNFTITITINEPGVILDYNPENVIVTIGDTMTALTPLVSNGTVEKWSIYPELDNGLDFANGIISGTPTSIQSKQTYKIWANNTGGNTYHDVNITILDIVPEISYNLVSIELTNDTQSSELPLNPANIGGPVMTWSITPDLSLGLSFDPATGVMRHADAGYPEAIDCARENSLNLPGILGR